MEKEVKENKKYSIQYKVLMFIGNLIKLPFIVIIFIFFAIVFIITISWALIVKGVKELYSKWS